MAGTTKNGFLKEERVAFDDAVMDFEDSSVYTEFAEKRDLGGDAMAERTNNTIWVPQPFQMDSEEGRDQTGNFHGHEELAVPISVNRHRSVPFTLNASELRNPNVLDRRRKAAVSRLSSDVESALRRQAVMYSSIVDARPGAATGFDDLASLMEKFDTQGVPSKDRIAVYSTRDMVKMASDLASRQTLNGKTQTAYEKAYINEIAGFGVHKDSTAMYLKGSTVTGATVAAANQRHIPRATQINEASGNEHNVDNRSMKLTVAKTGGTWKVGDAFTIAGVYAIHQKQKTPTGELKTFRVVGVDSDSQIEIIPAIVAADAPIPTSSESAYQNVDSTPANGAAITMLNKNDAYANAAFVDGIIEIVPATLELSPDDGWQTMSATLSSGIQLHYSRQADINDLAVKARWDITFGTALLNPEMAGIQLFNQA